MGSQKLSGIILVLAAPTPASQILAAEIIHKQGLPVLRWSPWKALVAHSSLFWASKGRFAPFWTALSFLPQRSASSPSLLLFEPQMQKGAG